MARDIHGCQTALVVGVFSVGLTHVPRFRHWDGPPVTSFASYIQRSRKRVLSHAIGLGGYVTETKHTLTWRLR